jgi:hypothetical protein
MHDVVAAFVRDLHSNPPSDLETFLEEDPERYQAHWLEFDLENGDTDSIRRAWALLPTLAERARRGETISFTEVCDFWVWGAPRSLGGREINPVAAICWTLGLPPLWTLIVSKKTGLPSGFWLEHSPEEQRARQDECFDFYGAKRA